MNITLDHRCGWSFAFVYYESDGETPVDCTGGSLAAEIRPEPGGELLGAFEFEWLDQAAGDFRWFIGAAAVDAIPDGTHRYDLIFTDSTGMPHKLRAGTILKQGTITDP